MSWCLATVGDLEHNCNILQHPNVIVYRSIWSFMIDQHAKYNDLAPMFPKLQRLNLVSGVFVKDLKQKHLVLAA